MGPPLALSLSAALVKSLSAQMFDSMAARASPMVTSNERKTHVQRFFSPMLSQMNYTPDFFRLEPKKSPNLKSRNSSSNTIILGLFQPFIFQGCIVFSPPFRRLLLRAPVGLLWHPTRVSPGQSGWFCSPQTIPSRPWWVPPSLLSSRR